MESELRWLKELEVSIHVRLVFTMCGWTLNVLLSLKKWNTTWNDTNPKPLWCLRGYTSFEPSDEKYCRWKGSCTSWYGKYPSIYRVLYIPGGAGFLPSTVAQIYILLLKKWLFGLQSKYPATLFDNENDPPSYNLRSFTTLFSAQFHNLIPTYYQLLISFCCLFYVFSSTTVNHH